MAHLVNLILYNARIYTVNPRQPVAQAMAVKDGKIVTVGTDAEIVNNFRAAEVRNMQQQCLYPGFADAHCHLIKYAQTLLEVDLRGCLSIQEMVERVRQYRAQHPQTKGIVGRGWDQNLWAEKVFPDNQLLNQHFPDIPVFLTRVNIHAAVANEVALQQANLTADTTINGGLIGVTDGKLNGLLVDYAMLPVAALFESFDEKTLETALLKAQQNCFTVGLTSLTDARTLHQEVKLLDRLQQTNQLKLRLACMIDGATADADYYRQRGILESERLQVRCIKYFADGALGSRGAWLLEPYSDAPEERGLQLYERTEFIEHLQACYQSGFQVATHAIGDAANRFVLECYANVLKNDRSHRWRVEHAQVLHPDDTHLFQQYGILPSIQPTHATSDYSWAADRLGNRIATAYRWQDLFHQHQVLAIGSDFPVETIDPMRGFRAAVLRQDDDRQPPTGFQPTQALTREQALAGMTLGAAFYNFQENNLGSLEIGKAADWIIMDTDLLHDSAEQLWRAKVLETWVAGEQVF